MRIKVLYYNYFYMSFKLSLGYEPHLKLGYTEIFKYLNFYQNRQAFQDFTTETILKTIFQLVIYLSELNIVLY